MNLILKDEQNKSLYVEEKKLTFLNEELTSFINNTSFSLSPSFPEEVLFPFELKNNNLIEGYQEDLASIIQIINNPFLKKEAISKEYQRIYNLFQGYDYILSRPELNESNLAKLYKLLSLNLLEPNEKLLPNNIYRHDDVFIYYTSNVVKKPDKGFKPTNVSKHMEELFNFINNDNNLSSYELFLKSQIIHFYLVYIHPYFDINGRTARTTSQWFLNNNDVYSYSLFNRGITYNKSDYYKIIRYAKLTNNITNFLIFMTKNTKIELEKEYIIRSATNYKELSAVEKQVLQYILSNNSLNTLIDFQKIYNRYNPYKSLKEIKDQLLEPLLSKNIINISRYTSKKIFKDDYNFEFKLNEKMFNYDSDNITRLTLKK